MLPTDCRDRQHMFPTSPSEMAICLTRIPNLLLHQTEPILFRVVLVQQLSRTVIGITNTQDQGKFPLDSFNTMVICGSIKTFKLFELGSF